MDEAPSRQVHKEMGVTHAEFFRVLPRVVEGMAVHTEGRIVTASGVGRRVEFVLGEEGRRRVGPTFAMPVTPVDIRLYGFDESAASAFLAKYDHHFFRGGG